MQNYYQKSSDFRNGSNPEHIRYMYIFKKHVHKFILKKIVFLMLGYLIMAFISFPERDDALLNDPLNPPYVESSGSLGLYHGDSKCVQTYPNLTISTDKKIDWCSNLARNNNEKPWIQFYFPNKMMKIRGYSVRNGCCYYACCCVTETSKVIDYKCCCELYSFSLQGSNDNSTWNIIHKVEGDKDYYHYCQFKTYEFKLTESYRYIRFVLDKERPGCPKCMQLNQIELYGEKYKSNNLYSSIETDETEESISIIGKLKKD